MDYFDWEYYVNRYDDLKKAGILNELKAKKHWMRFGIKENRICNKIFENFDIKKYATENKLNIGDLNNIYCHYNNFKDFYKNNKNITEKEMNNIYPSYYSFNTAYLENKDEFMYHYFSLIYLKNDKNIIHFEINKINLENIIFIIAGIENTDIILCSTLNNIIFDNKYREIINNLEYNMNETNHSFKFSINQYNTNYVLYFIINNDYLQHIPKNKYNLIIKNNSSDYLFIRKINNNITIDTKREINIINENNLNKFCNIPDEDIRIKFNNNEEKIMYLLDRKIFKICLDKYLNNNYLKFEDSFEINYKLSKKCDILMITNNDWSNTGYRFMKSLENEGINVILLKLNYHIFNYKHQGIVINTNNSILNKNPVIVDINNIDIILSIAHNINIIWFHASTMISCKKIPLYKYLHNKTYIVSHGGTTYRENPIQVGNYFNEFVNKTLVQCPDLLDLFENKNEELIYYPVDINLIKPDFSFKDNNKIVFSHYPSTSNIKGTKTILTVINKFKNKILYNGPMYKNKDVNERCSWEEQLLKYKKCDVYIETLNLEINGKPYGEWGNTCLEAAASGCVVITNCLNIDKYIKLYKNIPPILICNSEQELYNQIDKVINMKREDLLLLKKNTYDWVTKYHSIEACGKKLKKFIF